MDQHEKAREARRKAFAATGLSYSEYGRKFKPPMTKQAVAQGINGERQIDRLCRAFARTVMKKPVAKAFPEFYR
jgi:hypothetical protein